jgi:hypothetical protein
LPDRGPPGRPGAGSAIAQIGVVAVHYVAIATRDPLAGTSRSSSLKLDAIAASGDERSGSAISWNIHAADGSSI